MANLANTIWRDFVTDGVPSSGVHKVRKADVRVKITELESVVAAGALSDANWEATKTALDADLAHPAGKVGVVYSDSTATNNGLYVKSGSSGSGSWTQITTFLPGYQFITGTNNSSTANAIAMDTSPFAPTDDGVALFSFVIPVTNTSGTVTVSFDGGTALAVKTAAGNNPAIGGLVAGMPVLGVIANSGTEFRLRSDQASAAVQAAAEAAQAAAEAAQGLAEDAQAAAEAAAASIGNPINGNESVKTDDYAILAADVRKTIVANKASAITFTLPAAATAGAGYQVRVYNIGEGTLTVDGDGSEPINGVTTIDIDRWTSATLFTDGSSWRAEWGSVDRVPTWLGNNSLYKARAAKDRWLDSYRLAEEASFTGGGAAASDGAVLKALFDRAKAASIGEIILPRGLITLEGATLLSNPTSGNKPIRIVGQGPEQTLFQNGSAGTEGWLYVGLDADGLGIGVTLEGFGFTPSSGTGINDTDCMIFVRKFSGLQMKSLRFNAARRAVALGVGVTSESNNVVYTDMIDCTASGVSGGAPLISLGSGAVLNIKGGGRWNGSGSQFFISHTNTSRNWDGLYCYGGFFEDFSRYVNSTGIGIVNMEWTGGQIDRHAVGFYMEPSVVTGSNRNWNIHDTQLLGGPSTAGIGVFASKGSSTDSRAVEDIWIKNNFFAEHTSNAVWMPDGGGVVSNNFMNNCGRSGDSLIKVGTPLSGGYCWIHSNIAYRHSGAGGSAYTYGIDFTTTTTGQRFQWDNNFQDAGTGAINGTA